MDNNRKLLKELDRYFHPRSGFLTASFFVIMIYILIVASLLIVSSVMLGCKFGPEVGWSVLFLGILFGLTKDRGS